MKFFAHWIFDQFLKSESWKKLIDNIEMLTSTSCPGSGSLARIIYIKADAGAFSGTYMETPINHEQ